MKQNVVVFARQQAQPDQFIGILALLFDFEFATQRIDKLLFQKDRRHRPINGSPKVGQRRLGRVFQKFGDKIFPKRVVVNHFDGRCAWFAFSFHSIRFDF